MNPAEMARALNAIRPTMSYGDFGNVDIVVEAVVENPKVKHAVLAEVEQHVKEDAIIASNTSTISITYLRSEERRVGKECRTRRGRRPRNRTTGHALRGVRRGTERDYRRSE